MIPSHNLPHNLLLTLSIYLSIYLPVGSIFSFPGEAEGEASCLAGDLRRLEQSSS